MSKYPKTLGRIEAVWNKLGGEEGVDRLLRGELMLAAAESDLHSTGELTLEIPALSRPTPDELRQKFSWIKKIERDDSTTEAVTLVLSTILKEGENQISGKEHERRLAPSRTSLLGYQQAQWLVEHQDEFPDLMALLGKIYIDFPGLVVVHLDGSRDVSCLDRYGERWYLFWNWFGHDFGSYDRVASSSK